MSDLRSVHADLGATFEAAGDREVVAHYGRPERAHRAVRNGVGVVEMAYGVLVVEGDDRVSYVDNVVSNRVPAEDGRGCYALLLSPQGRVQADLFVYTAAERVLVFTPPGRAGRIADGWQVFIEDVSFAVASEEFRVLGVHGPQATEKVGGVLSGAAPPEDRLRFVRGSIDGAGVTVVRTDAPTGEPGYEVICATPDSAGTFEALLHRGTGAVPFGRRTWETLTLEAGTPLFGTELEGRIPNAAGLRSSLDFEKGCYVGQEVVSRIENRGHPNERLVGLRPEAVPAAGAAVFADDRSVGEVTRAAESPSLETPVALAYLEWGLENGGDLTVRVEGTDVPASRVDLPFVEGAERSGRLPGFG